jgi:hypothetical protein
VWIEFIGSGWGPVIGSCENFSEPSGFLTSEEFLESQGDLLASLEKFFDRVINETSLNSEVHYKFSDTGKTLYKHMHI